MGRNQELFDLVAGWAFSATLFSSYCDIMSRNDLSVVVDIRPPFSKLQYLRFMEHKSNFKNCNILTILTFQIKVINVISQKRSLIESMKI